jgi:hypothetical protein
MAVLFVTYDLKKPGRNYEPVWSYLKQFTHCKGLESVWFLDTNKTAAQVRDDLNALVDNSDRTFVCPISKSAVWASYNMPCADWLNSSARNW